jgi:hypothetical protein
LWFGSTVLRVGSSGDVNQPTLSNNSIAAVCFILCLRLLAANKFMAAKEALSRRSTPLVTNAAMRGTALNQGAHSPVLVDGAGILMIMNG